MKLRESEEHFRLLAENARDLIYRYRLTPPSGFEYVSPAATAITGYTPEEHYADPNLGFKLIHPDDRLLLEKVMTRPPESPVVLRWRHKDGRLIWTEQCSKPVYDKEGNLRAIEGIARDVTERKEAEEKLRRESSFVQLLRTVAVAANQTSSFEEAARTFIKLVCAQIGWPVGHAYLLAAENGADEPLLAPTGLWHLEDPRKFEGFREATETMSFARGEGLPGRVLASGRPVWIANVAEDPSFARAEFAAEGGLKAGFAFPVVVDAEVAAVLEFFSERVTEPDEALLEVMAAVGSQLGRVIEHEQGEKALRESEERFRATFEQSAVGIAHNALDGRWLRVNQRLCDILGYSREELLQKTIQEITHPDDLDADPGYTEQLLAGEIGSFSMEKRYIKKDGSVVRCNLTVSLVRGPSGEPSYTTAIIEDITERMHAEQSLRRSLDMLLALREAGQVLGSTLSSEEILARLLEIMRGVSDLTATVISVEDEDGELRIWLSAGLEGLRRRARFEHEAEAARRATLEDEHQHLFRLHGSGAEEDRLVGLCLPLRVKDRVVGVLEAYGRESLVGSATEEILSSLASQAASALENALLYEELGERERALQDLVGKLLRAQEEEHRRIAYEVHDGLAQVAVAAHQRLEAFSERHRPGTERGRRDLERIMKLVQTTVSDARRIIANLRPTTLDDLGLAVTMDVEVELLREEGYQVDYEQDLGDERLPDTVEITLFRIAQESLNNVRKHAQTRRVRIELRRQGDEAYLEVRDFGRGFDPAGASTGSGPGERVGLAGMRERALILGGRIEIQSQPGAGTSVAATIPLTRAITAKVGRYGG